MIHHNLGILFRATTRVGVASLLLAALLLGGCQRPGGSAGDGVAGSFPEDAPVATLWVTGMGCPLCAHNIDQQLKDLPGVRAVRVDLGTGKVTAVLAASNPPTKDQLARAIVASGFTLTNVQMPESKSTALCGLCSCESCECATSDSRCQSACSCRV